MKRFVYLLALIPALALAQSVGQYNVTVSNKPYGVAFTKPGYVFVYNAGTNVAFASFGGHTDDDTYSTYIPLRPAAQYTTKEKFTYISVICASNSALNTQVDIGQE